MRIHQIAILSSLFFIPPAFALFEINHEETGSDYGFSAKGGVDDSLFYSIGGGTVVSQAPNNMNMQRLSVGGGWKSNLTCGNFDLEGTVKNQLNGITDGFKGLMGDVISGATGAVASLPAMIIQRANPGLYEILSNGVLQGSVAFDKSMLNCQTMSTALADFSSSDKWTQAAIGEEFKKIVSVETDAIKATQQQQNSTGQDGVKWIGGQQQGGAGQYAIKPTHDLTKAGYNIINGLPATSDNTVNDPDCNNALCRRYKTSEAAAQAVVDILGDKSIRTCVESEDCSSGGAENEPNSSVVGAGFYSLLDETAKENQTILLKLINGDETLNKKNLNSLKSGDLVVTRGVILALREDPDNGALVQRLAGELSIADTLSTALAMRRMLIVGKSEPYAANQTMAQDEIDRRLAFLDREIQAMKDEMEIRKAVSNNTLLVTLNRQQERNEYHRLQQKISQDDLGFSQLSQEKASE